MTDVPLSAETQRLAGVLFSGSDLRNASSLLERECGANLPFLEKLDSKQLERFRFAVLKLSGGNLSKLLEAVMLAQTDWRDVLVAAGFADDLHAHEKWAATLAGRSNIRLERRF